MKKHYPKIEVFFTSTGHFRAKINENIDARPYEVSVGSEGWEKGKGREFEVIIFEKCEKLIERMQKELLFQKIIKK